MEAKKKPVVSVPIHIRKNGKLPVGKQITRELIRLRSRGALKPGDRLPGIRSLASDLGVAPNTVAGAYAELSATGFAVSKPASGYFVAETKPIPEPPPAGSRPPLDAESGSGPERRGGRGYRKL